MKLYSYYSECDSNGEFCEETDTSLSDIEWSSMIQDSFEQGDAMVYSIDPSRTRHPIDERWDDFITVAPTCEILKVPLRKDIIRPLLSFGISCKMSECDMMLKSLSYLGIYRHVTELLVEFFEGTMLTHDEVRQMILSMSSI